jgi:hypothetical protein
VVRMKPSKLILFFPSDTGGTKSFVSVNVCTRNYS